MSLLSTKNVADLPARIQRFRMRMMCFTYTISHVPGRDLYTSEALSRAPIVRPLKQEEEKQTDDAKAYVDSVIKRVPASEDGLEELRSQQQQDEVTQGNSSPIVLMVGPRNPTFSPLKACWPERGEMTVQQGLLLKGNRLVIPVSMRLDVLDKLNEGHQGITKSRERERDKTSVW